MAAPLILVEAQPRRPADGVAETIRFAGGGGAKPYLYGGQHWRAGIAGLPTIITSVDFNGEDIGSGGVPQAMTLRWAPARQAVVAAMAAYHWMDADITVRVGPEGALPPVLTSGKVLDATVDAGALTLSLADPAAGLKVQLLTDRFAGTGGAEGPPEWEGRIKRRAWGRCYNIQGDPIDPPNNVYSFGDPARPWKAILTVRDKGASASTLEIVAWQGTVAATFAALQAAQVPSGGGVVAPSIAMVKWWTQPSGSLCVDIYGEIGDGYVETAPEIAGRIVGEIGSFAAGTIAAAAVARPGAYGFYADDESVTVSAALDQVLGDVSLLWVLDGNAIAIRQWAWGDPVASARSIDVKRRASYKPVTRRKLGYRRNNYVMSRDAIAGIVLASDVTYNDGQTGEDLKPAEPGATNGAKPDSPLGDDGRTVGDVLADLDLNGSNFFSLAQLTDTRDAIMLARTSLAGQEIGLVIQEAVEQQVADHEATLETFSLLGTKVGGGESWILNLDTVMVTPTESIGQRFSSIDTTLGQHTSSISILTQATVDSSGNALSKFVLAQQADGKIAGIVSNVTGELSQLDFVFDLTRFWIKQPDGSYVLAFSIGSDEDGPLVEAPRLRVGILVNDTALRGSFKSETTRIDNNGTWIVLDGLTSTIDMPKGGWVEAIFVATLGFNSGDASFTAELYIDNTLVYTIDSGLIAKSITMSGAKVCDAGLRTVYVRFRGDSSIDTNNRSMFVKGYPATTDTGVIS